MDTNFDAVKAVQDKFGEALDTAFLNHVSGVDPVLVIIVKDNGNVVCGNLSPITYMDNDGKECYLPAEALVNDTYIHMCSVEKMLDDVHDSPTSPVWTTIAEMLG